MTPYEVMKSKLGLQEVRDRKQLMEFLKEYAHNGDIAVDPSTTSWCAASVNACERSQGRPGTTVNPCMAQSFNTYGEEVDEGDVEEGDILVFHFSFDESWQGHVTYFVKWNDDQNTVTCLGGNQDNGVKYSDYSQDAIKHIRRFK